MHRVKAWAWPATALAVAVGLGICLPMSKPEQPVYRAFNYLDAPLVARPGAYRPF